MSSKLNCQYKVLRILELGVKNEGHQKKISDIFTFLRSSLLEVHSLSSTVLLISSNSFASSGHLALY